MGIFSGLFDTSKNDKAEKEVKRLKVYLMKKLD